MLHKRDKEMKKIIRITISMITCILFLVNWTSQDATISGNKKHRVNFYGLLETQEGNIYKVENISIGMKYKQIYFFEAPNKIPHDRILTLDPRKGFIAKIDLSEIYEVKVPHPNLRLSFKKGSGKKEYIEVIIVLRDQDKTERTYLIEPNRKIECDEVTSAGTIEMESMSFAALKRLVINGYRYRDPQNSKADNGQTQTKKK